MTASWNWLAALPRWQLSAACKGQGADVDGAWFAGDAESVRSAKAICAGCPVLAECLEYALVESIGHGIWGGCGENDRRAFGRLRRERTHSDPRIVDDCACRWCGLLRVHHARLDGADMPLRTFGPRATHGRRVTFARGCRCGPCSIAAVVPDRVAALIPDRRAKPTPTLTPKEPAA